MDKQNENLKKIKIYFNFDFEIVYIVGVYSLCTLSIWHSCCSSTWEESRLTEVCFDQSPFPLGSPLVGLDNLKEYNSKVVNTFIPPGQRNRFIWISDSIVWYWTRIQYSVLRNKQHPNQTNKQTKLRGIFIFSSKS